MKRAPVVVLPRPTSAPRRKPRSRPEAAAELVRVEYERDRLQRDLEMVAQRRAASEQALKRADARARFLRKLMDESDPQPSPNGKPGRGK